MFQGGAEEEVYVTLGTLGVVYTHKIRSYFVINFLFIPSALAFLNQPIETKCDSLLVDSRPI